MTTPATTANPWRPVIFVLGFPAAAWAIHKVGGGDAYGWNYETTGGVGRVILIASVSGGILSALFGCAAVSACRAKRVTRGLAFAILAALTVAGAIWCARSFAGYGAQTAATHAAELDRIRQDHNQRMAELEATSTGNPHGVIESVGDLELVSLPGKGYAIRDKQHKVTFPFPGRPDLHRVVHQGDETPDDQRPTEAELGDGQWGVAAVQFHLPPSAPSMTTKQRYDLMRDEALKRISGGMLLKDSERQVHGVALRELVFRVPDPAPGMVIRMWCVFHPATNTVYTFTVTNLSDDPGAGSRVDELFTRVDLAP